MEAALAVDAGELATATMLRAFDAEADATAEADVATDADVVAAAEAAAPGAGVGDARSLGAFGVVQPAAHANAVRTGAKTRIERQYRSSSRAGR